MLTEHEGWRAGQEALRNLRCHPSQYRQPYQEVLMTELDGQVRAS